LSGLLLYASGGFYWMSGVASTYLDAGILLAVLATVEAEAMRACRAPEGDKSANALVKMD
jgi:hypothetical protein